MRIVSGARLWKAVVWAAVMCSPASAGDAADSLRLDPVPGPLAARKAVHPRLHVTPQRLAELRGRISAEPYRSLLAEVRRVADDGVRRGPPAYRLADSSSGDEQLWQRPVGNMIPHLAICYLLSGQRKYLDSARAWMLASAAYKTWGLGRIDGLDLAAGHQLYGLALGYDWLHDELGDAARQTIRQCLLRRGTFMFDKLQSRQAWWHKAYLQNHQWVNMTGLAAAGLALYGESGQSDVDGWITLGLRMFKRTLASLGPDGASHEGLPYWTYGLEYLLKFGDLAGDLLGEDLIAHSEWFRNTASFCQYFTLPRGAWRRGSCLMTFADGPRAFWYGPDYMLRRLAAVFRDGHAQWLADELNAADLCSAEARFLNLLWVDPSVTPVGPAGLATFRHFADMGLVVMRGGWDGREAMLAFKCGPHIGHHAVRMYSYDPGGGHVHPDAGSILLMAFGEWLIVDDGYTFKTTAWQNTALVGGVGQIGEGRSWFAGSTLCAASRGASILLARAGERFDYAVGDAAAAYDDRAGLDAFRRHVVYVKPACWLVIDELAARKPTVFELRFHGDFAFQPAGEGSFTVVGGKGRLRITSLGDRPAAMRAEVQKLKSTGGQPAGELNCLVLSNDPPSAGAMFVTVLQAAPADKPFNPQPKWLPARAGGGEGGAVQIRQGGRESTFHLLPSRKDPAQPIAVELR